MCTTRRSIWFVVIHAFVSDLLISCLSRIAHIIADGDIPTELIRYHFTDLVVASLRNMPEYKHMVCRWSAMLSALQGDDRRKSMNRSDQRQHLVKQRVLTQMLVTSVRMEISVEEASSEHDADMVAARRARDDLLLMNSNEKKKGPSSSLHEALTTALLRTLPELLVSFKTDKFVVQSLSALPEYFCKFAICNGQTVWGSLKSQEPFVLLFDAQCPAF
jgi:hypothetical protein